uniref:Uncharacterized protein n=1 Tax=Falco tinnunculus TaxID=100819 RepID=A0A8C4U8H8_FALTI
MESSLADFVGGGFHPFVEPWFILFLVLFLDSLPVPGSHFPFVELYAQQLLNLEKVLAEKF